MAERVIEGEKSGGLPPRGCIAPGADGAAEFANVFIRVEVMRPVGGSIRRECTSPTNV
jgi:hypothetical protein